MSVPYYPSNSVKEFGEKVNTAMYDASIQLACGGLGGCKVYDINTFEPEVRPYIEAYLAGNLDSIALTYAAMRAKEVEDENIKRV
jgi:hypothetical protein